MALEHRVPSIPRRPAGASSAFEALRDRGIRILQELAGELWTDYNLHDPGITILEQLCYGLTELLYRIDFPVEDHLTGPDGRIDFRGQALHRPESALPCRPTTPEDYRRAILDAVPGVENVWVDPWPAPVAREGPPRGGGESVSPWTGVHRVRLHLDHETPDARRLREQVRAWFHAHRNLGEDLHPEVTTVDEVPCRLGIRLEVAGSRAPEEILAQVYALARRHVAGRGDRPTAGAGGERSLEQAFDGPLAPGGVAGSWTLPRAGRVHLVDLVARVRGVEGVAEVGDLYLEVDGVAHRSSLERVSDAGVLCLHVPRSGSDPERVELTRAGRPVPLSGALVREKYRELSDAERHAERDRRAASSLYRLPTGQSRGDAPYRSIQEEFPAAYGVNRFGLPESATDAERARVAQLKAYLVPLEQLLANRMAGISRLRDLFSIGDPGGPTAWYHVLGDDEVPGVDELWREDPGPVLEEAFHGFDGLDHRWERRNRLLDHMLAVYGERFDPAPVHRLQEGDAPVRALEEVVRAKAAFLRHVMTVGRDRGGAFDHTRPSWGEGEDGGGAENVSGFQRRVGLLLGFPDPGSRSLVEPLDRHGLRLVPHERVEEALDGRAGPSPVDGDQTLEPLPPGAPRDGLGLEELTRTVARLGVEVLSDLLFARGADPAGYRVGREGDRWVVVFRPGAGERRWKVGEFEARSAALEAARDLQAWLRALNRACEGVHVLEHVLLRPEGGTVGPEVAGRSAQELWAHFYPHRVTLVFPAWPARCRDGGFRTLAEETARRNAPAHLHLACHWLDPSDMADFEGRLRRWLVARADASADPEERDAAAGALVERILAWEDARDASPAGGAGEDGSR